MSPLSPAGQQVIDDVARRHGISTEAALTMLDAVVRGNGNMAQFSHPEFSGSGQWMRGGMTMVSDMFNHQLKGRVDALCFELANLVASQPGLVQGGSFQSQSQDGREQFQRSHGEPAAAPSFGGASLFVPPQPDWWGPDLRWPDSTGSQDGVRYACFAQARRLAIEVDGVVTIYDTLDHQIGGFSQQQSGAGTLSFNSQYGLIDVGSLPVVSVAGRQGASPMSLPASSPAFPSERRRGTAPAAVEPVAPLPSAPSGAGHPPIDIVATIEKLAELHGKGVLDDAEFQAKKVELLGRL